MTSSVVPVFVMLKQNMQQSIIKLSIGKGPYYYYFYLIHLNNTHSVCDNVNLLLITVFKHLNIGRTAGQRD